LMNYNEDSNPNAAQWQLRDAVGAGCDMPMAYYPNAYPTKPYKGPVNHLGTYYAKSPFWDDSFWDSIDEKDYLNDKNMLVSFVTGSEVIQTVSKESYRSVLYALMTGGTYPTTRSLSGGGHFAPDEVPAKWKERQRIVVAGNCFDNGLLPDQIGRFYSYIRDATGSKHKYDNTGKYVYHGTNRCADHGAPPPEVAKARDDFVRSLAQPPWTRWGKP